MNIFTKLGFVIHLYNTFPIELALNLSEKSNYNSNMVWINKLVLCGAVVLYVVCMQFHVVVGGV